MFAVPCAWMLEHPDVRLWSIGAVNWLSREGLLKDLHLHTNNNNRIYAARNSAVEEAKARKCDFLLFCDPDMRPDACLDVHGPNNPDLRSWARPFLQSSMELMHNEYCGVIGAPAVTGPPDCKVNVFVQRHDQSFSRITREEYAQVEPCFMQVAAIGTGLMLIDMEVFNVLKPPYFADQLNPTPGDPHTDVLKSQDSVFCLKCNEAKIPVFANFFSPAGHHKTDCYLPPTWDGVERAHACPTQLALTENSPNRDFTSPPAPLAPPPSPSSVIRSVPFTSVPR
jgi:hypothetical protein